jgi:hypothetical protein
MIFDHEDGGGIAVFQKMAKLILGFVLQNKIMDPISYIYLNCGLHM